MAANYKVGYQLLVLVVEGGIKYLSFEDVLWGSVKWFVDGGRGPCLVEAI